MRLEVDAIVDPLAATVLVERATGRARFDIAGVPRVDPLLAGRPAAEVPALVTRLCGLCPVTHHLAGVAALDPGPLPATAAAVRALLHHGSVLEVMGPRLAPRHALEFKKFGKQVLRAAGCPGHFPDVAVPGGVAAPADAAEVAAVRAELGGIAQLIDVTVDAAPAGMPPGWADGHGRLDVTVADAAGNWDPLGRFLRAGDELIPAAEVPERIRETRPGEINPRPEIRVGGHWHPYRVGACARHPGLAPQLAQALTLRESLAAITSLVDDPALVASPPAADDQPAGLHDGVGVGLVDGPRGLLVHEYEVAEGVLRRARILSPTAQNEGWLADLLTRAVAQGLDLEAPVRAADPCLPCTSAPRGKMNITVKEI